MHRVLIHWLVTTLTIYMLPRVISGVHVDGLSTALAAAAILAVLNALVRPILVILTLPLTVLSLGFFLLVINAFMFEFAGYLVKGFVVDTFGAAFLASLTVSVVSWLMNSRLQKRDGAYTVIVRGGKSDPERASKQIIDVTNRNPRDWQ